MNCPKCYSKIKKGTCRCDTCGFNILDLNEATNAEGKKALKSVYKDDVLWTTELPKDVKKKSLLLKSIFLGLFGVHNFSVGRFWQGLYMAVSSAITIILTVIISLMGTITNTVFQIAFEFWSVFQGITLIIWIIDIVNIARNRFKVPVYKESFSE